MKIRLLSDLHAEGGFDRELLKTHGEDVTVIAGDLHTGANNVWSMLKQFADHQPNVIFVLGNHEHYHHDYDEVCHKLDLFSENTSIKVLNPGTVFYSPISRRLVKHTEEKDAVAFIGASLWTNFRENPISEIAAARGINDFRVITKGNNFFSTNNAKELFYRDSAYIKHQYESIKLKKVIVSHFLPAVESIDKQYLVPGITSTLNEYFANDLGGWISELDNVPLFLHGHTHSNVDITLGSTRICANPYGYGKNRKYKELILEV